MKTFDSIYDLCDFINSEESYPVAVVEATAEKNGWMLCNDDQYVLVKEDSGQLLRINSEGEAGVIDVDADTMKDIIERCCK